MRLRFLPILLALGLRSASGADVGWHPANLRAERESARIFELAMDAAPEITLYTIDPLSGSDTRRSDTPFVRVGSWNHGYTVTGELGP